MLQVAGIAQVVQLFNQALEVELTIGMQLAAGARSTHVLQQLQKVESGMKRVEGCEVDACG